MIQQSYCSCRRLRLMNKQAKGTTTQPTEAKKDLSKPDGELKKFLLL